jgi:hypothetical protein
MFEGNVAVPNLSEVDWDDNDGVSDEVREGFPEVGEELKASFSINVPAEIEYIVIVSDIEKVSCEVYQNEKMLGVPVRDYVATSQRVIERSGRIQFGGVVQSWNLSLGQRSLAESAAGISSTMIEMTSMIPRAQWACLQCGEHGAISTPEDPLGSSTVQWVHLNCHLGQTDTATSCKWQQRISMLPRAFRKSGHAASLSLRCTAKLRN